jgi:hypothetical protein
VALVAGASLIFASAALWKAASSGRPFSENDVYADVGNWLADGEATERALDEQLAILQDFHVLLEETVDAVIAERITLDEAAQRIQDFCVVRYPAWLDIIKTINGDRGSSLAEIRANILRQIQTGMRVGLYAAVPSQ